MGIIRRSLHVVICNDEVAEGPEGGHGVKNIPQEALLG